MNDRKLSKEDQARREAIEKESLVAAYQEFTDVRNVDDRTELVRQILRAYDAVKRLNVARRDRHEEGTTFFWADAHSIVASAYFAAIENVPVEQMPPISVRGEQLVALIAAAQALAHADGLFYLTMDCDPTGDSEADVALGVINRHIMEREEWDKERTAEPDNDAKP